TGNPSNQTFDVASLSRSRSQLEGATKIIRKQIIFLRATAQANGRVQPRCGAQRSNVGCNPLLDASP
ncbi:MAG: hypothetical protein WC749_13050, partial [Dehalococcoidia bacterium]